MKQKYTVQYLIGGSSNFLAKELVGFFEEKEAIQEVEKLNKQGYVAMKCHPIIGGFCDYSEFETDQERMKYWDRFIVPMRKEIGI